MEDEFWTKEQVLLQVAKIEGFTGMSCQHVSDLPKNATDEDYNLAWQQDRCWIRGYADTILEMT